MACVGTSFIVKLYRYLSIGLLDDLRYRNTIWDASVNGGF